MSVTELEQEGTFLGDSSGMVPILMPTKNRNPNTAAKTLHDLSPVLVFRGSFRAEIVIDAPVLICTEYGPTEPIATSLIDAGSSAAKIPAQDVEMAEPEDADLVVTSSPPYAAELPPSSVELPADLE